MCVYFCGGFCVEDVSSHLMPIFRFTPTCALQCGYHPQGVEGTCKGEQNGGSYGLDFDHQFIETEKYGLPKRQ